MRPFQEFRLWARRAPTGEKAAAGVATAIVIVLVAWLLVPGSTERATNVSSNGGESGASAGQTLGTAAGAAAPGAQGAAAGAAAGGGANGPAGASGGPSARAAAPGAANASGPVGPGCPPLAAGTRGVSATQIKVAVMIVDVAGPAADST